MAFKYDFDEYVLMRFLCVFSSAIAVENSSKTSEKNNTLDCDIFRRQFENAIEMENIELTND